MKKSVILLLSLTLGLLLLTAAGCAETEVFRPEDLPVLYLHIDGGQAAVDRMNGSPDHSERCTGTLDIAVPDGYDGQFGGRYPQASVTGLELEYIRGRGNGTWDMAKNPYKFKLSEKRGLFGMGKSKHWVLLANYFDNSLLRNWMTAWLGGELGLPYTPQGVFVEVVMEGDYLGVYYLCEQVRVEKARLAIDALTAEDRTAPAVWGGYLLELFPDDEEAPGAFATEHGVYLGVKDPNLNPSDGGYAGGEQLGYIRDYVQRAEDAVFAGSGYEDLIDLRSAADYWWIQEFTVNGDAFRTDSAHLYKPRFEADGGEGRLHFGPLWDFDESWGNAQIETRQDIGFNNASFPWISALRTLPEFRALLGERWRAADAKLEELLCEGGALDRMAAILADGWARDHARWASAREEDGTDAGRDFAREIAHIRTWAGLRRAWINANLDRLGLITFTLTVRGEGLEERQYEIDCDTQIALDDIEIPEDRLESLTGWRLEDGTLADDFLLMDRDITLTAVFGESGEWLLFTMPSVQAAKNNRKTKGTKREETAHLEFREVKGREEARTHGCKAYGCRLVSPVGRGRGSR